MPIPYVRKAYAEGETQPDGTAEITELPEKHASHQAVDAYNLVEASTFPDDQKNTLNALVATLTGYVPAGYATDRKGNVEYVKGKPQPEEAAVDHLALTASQSHSQSHSQSQSDKPQTKGGN